MGKVTTTFQTTSHFSSNPVFTAGASAGPAASLQEERRLLVEERSRQGSKFGKKHSKNVEIVPSTLLSAKDDISNPETVNKDSVNISDIPSLSAVTDKIQLDSIAQCYSSLLKGFFANTCDLNMLYCRITEFLVPNITSELYFILQLLTVAPTRAAYCTGMYTVVAMVMVQVIIMYMSQISSLHSQPSQIVSTLLSLLSVMLSSESFHMDSLNNNGQSMDKQQILNTKFGQFYTIEHVMYRILIKYLSKRTVILNFGHIRSRGPIATH